MLSKRHRSTFGATLNSIYISLISVWTALLLAGVLIIIYPVPGTAIWITLASILSSSLTAPILGPVGGTISGFFFGLAAPYVNSSTALPNPALTFIPPALGALTSGLYLFNRWKEASLVLVSQMIIWFIHPFAFYKLMPIVSWEYWLALVLIVTPSIRKRIIDSIVSRNPKNLTVALWCLAWISRIGGDVIAGNNIYIWIFGWTYNMYIYWAPMTIYYAVVDSLNCLAGAVIGTAVLLALKRSGIRVLALDFFEDSWNKKIGKAENEYVGQKNKRDSC
jgi:hypothetical protein